MHITVILPTYNEAENLPKLVSALFMLPLELHVLSLIHISEPTRH